MSARTVQLSLGIALWAVGASAQTTTATINVDTSQPTPLNPNFSGFNYEGATSYEPYDYKFNGVAAQLSPGWIRYPGGIVSDAFNWQTGLMNSSWVTEFSSTAFATTLTDSIEEVGGKGGQQFLDVGREAILLGAKLIVVINGYTDTAADAGALATLAKNNHIPVAVWELCNEPYFFASNFFKPTSGPVADAGAYYAGLMQPYYNAIKDADSTAVVALFFSDPGNPDPTWDSSVAGYSPQYWDAITYHFYGAETSGTDFSQWMADENANLYGNSASYVTDYVAPKNLPTTKYLVSEFNPTGSDLGNNPSLTNGTLYAGIYAAEYIMRMSTVPSVLHVGMHALSSTYGVNANNRHFSEVQNAYNDQTMIDTATLIYGFFPSAEAQGVAIINGVLRNATQVYSTTVTGGATVAATGLSPIPALYAQGYNGPEGQSLVITNKSATAHTVTVNLNGPAVSGSLPLTFITGTDPSMNNTATTDIAVPIQTSSSTNPIPVPPYSVVRVDLSGGITIQTNPPGLQFSVAGGAAATAPQFLNLSPGLYSLQVASTQAGPAGTEYVFTGWSDGGAANHNITVTASPATYTATFKAQYQLTTAVSSSVAGSVSPASGTYFDAGSIATVMATANAPWAFSSWSGDASGTTNPVQVVMNEPHSVTAFFVNTLAACDVNGDGLVNVNDVQALVNESLGAQQALNDLNADGVVNAIDVQMEINTVLGGACLAT